MGYKWENVTGCMRVEVNAKDNEVEMTVSVVDAAKNREVGLFIIDSDSIYSLSKRQSVHTKYESSRRYAYLLKRPSGNLGELLDEAIYRLSTPLYLPINNFSCLTDIMLEHKVKAPDWEDVTSQCKPEFIKSTHSGGFYVMLMHGGSRVALLGSYRGGVMMAQRTSGKYRIELAKGAAISFHVFKKNY